MVALPTPIRQPGRTVQRVARAEPGSRNRCIRGQRRGLSHGDRPDGTSRAVSQTRRTPSVEKRASLRPRHGPCIAGSASNRAVQFENPGVVGGSPVVARMRRPCLRATTTALRWLGRATAIGDYSMEVLSRRRTSSAAILRAARPRYTKRRRFGGVSAKSSASTDRSKVRWGVPWSHTPSGMHAVTKAPLWFRTCSVHASISRSGRSGLGRRRGGQASTTRSAMRAVSSSSGSSLSR